MCGGWRKKPAEGFDHIEWELQNLFLMLQPKPTLTQTYTEPFGEVVHQYTTHCIPHRNYQN